MEERGEKNRKEGKRIEEKGENDRKEGRKG